MKIEYTLPSGTSVEADIQELNQFIDCENFVKSPFSRGKTFLRPNISNTHKNIIIRCYIPEDETTKIILNSSSSNPQSVCTQIIQKYVADKWGDNCMVGETLICNHSECQYEYWVEK